MIRIGVAEDQQIFRKGLVMLLNSFKDTQVIHEAENGQDLLDQITEDTPDVVILDYSMPVKGGVETAKELKEKYPCIKIIILSMYDEQEFIEAAIENGANGYLSKDDDLNELEAAIKGVLTNHYYLNDRLSKIFLNTLIQKGKIDPAFGDNKIEFSPDEKSIIELLCKEYTSTQIGEALNLSQRTIEKYKTRMMEKVGAQNSIGIIMYAIKNKIIHI